MPTQVTEIKTSQEQLVLKISKSLRLPAKRAEPTDEIHSVKLQCAAGAGVSGNLKVVTRHVSVPQNVRT